MARIGFILIASIFLMGCSNEIIDIESQNEFEWQKYMNEDEFQKVEIGMSYIEVVKIAGGAGEKVAAQLYEWPDEQLMTQAYELKFKNDKLVEKKIIEKRGNSTR